MTRLAERKLSNSIFLGLSALTIGWMVGMSLSPIVNTVISSLITIIITITSLLVGLKFNNEDVNSKSIIGKVSSISLLPLALLTFFLAVGSGIGIYTRTHNLLGIKETSSPNNKGRVNNDSLQHTAGLFSLTVEQCQLLELSHGDQLKTRLKAIGDNNVDYLINQCANDSCLEAIKNIICSSK